MKMGKIMIVGCGGVGSVAVHKCCQNSDAFSEVVIASRTLSKCDALKEKLQGTTKTKITTAQVDADDTAVLTELIRKEKPDAVLNLALPYQDLLIMEACLAAGVHYIDTANYEPEDTAKFEYKWQWEYRERFENAGLTALLGSGFDPGVTGVFSAYALKHYFDEINYIDILDCNAGDNGYPFATNFNPEINIREVSANGSYWEDGRVSGSQHSGDQEDPLLHDIQRELSDTPEMSGECGNDVDRAGDVQRAGDYPAPVPEDTPSGSGVARTENKGKDQYRLHFHRKERREREEAVHL